MHKLVRDTVKIQHATVDQIYVSGMPIVDNLGTALRVLDVEIGQGVIVRAADVCAGKHERLLQ